MIQKIERGSVTCSRILLSIFTQRAGCDLFSSLHSTCLFTPTWYAASCVIIPQRLSSWTVADSEDINLKGKWKSSGGVYLLSSYACSAGFDIKKMLLFLLRVCVRGSKYNNTQSRNLIKFQTSLLLWYRIPSNSLSIFLWQRGFT